VPLEAADINAADIDAADIDARKHGSPFALPRIAVRLSFTDMSGGNRKSADDTITQHGTRYAPAFYLVTSVAGHTQSRCLPPCHSPCHKDQPSDDQA
jgi:hypothetical protein